MLFNQSPLPLPPDRVHGLVCWRKTGYFVGKKLALENAPRDWSISSMRGMNGAIHERASGQEMWELWWTEPGQPPRVEGKSVIRTNEHQLGEGEGQRCLERWVRRKCRVVTCYRFVRFLGQSHRPSWAMDHKVLCYTHRWALHEQHQSLWPLT